MEYNITFVLGAGTGPNWAQDRHMRDYFPCAHARPTTLGCRILCPVSCGRWERGEGDEEEASRDSRCESAG